MRILVTGGGGFIGSHVVDALVARGHEVRVLDSAVGHQAAMVGLGRGFVDAPEYVRANDLGTALLLLACREAGVRRFLLGGSMAVYGEGAYTHARA